MFRNQRFNILIFLLVFAILYYGFLAYIGIISPGGKGYIPFLHKYADVPAWLTYGICKGAKSLLQLFGYNVYQKAPNNITINGGRGVNIIWACLGVGVMSCWIAFIAAHKADWKYKLKWILTGTMAILVINITRMDLIALGLHYNWERFNALNVHSSFTIVSYIAVLGLTFLFIKKYNTYKLKDFVR